MPRSHYCRSSFAALVRTWATSVPAGDKALIDLLGLLNASAFLIAGGLDVVVVGATSLAPCGGMSRRQLEPAQLRGVEGGRTQR